MKKLFISIIVSCVLFACKKKEIPERWPQEHYQIFTNQFIKYTSYQGWAGWRLEKGGNKNVAFYVFEGFDTRQCADCGSPMIAFEFDTMKSNFELKEPQDLLNVNAIIGVTSSFGGPMASRLDSAVIKGQKINNSTWYITIKRKSKLNNSNIEGVFKVVN